MSEYELAQVLHFEVPEETAEFRDSGVVYTARASKNGPIK